jgi:diguanylate cyclase (GGDEF)-like protein/PAS domain S-box-containing protein
VNKPDPTFPLDDSLQAELEKFRQQRALLDRTELIAHIGHFEWSYELDRLLSCSEEYARIHDMTVEEVMSAHRGRDKLLQQVHPDDRAAFRASEHTLRRQKSVDIEYRLILENGDIRHIRESAVEVNDEAGNEIGSFGILQDISERIKHQRDLEYRDELARQSEAITDIGHFIYDEENDRYVYMSPGCARIYGTSVEEYVAKIQSLEDDLADIFAEDRERVAEEYENYRNTGQDCAIEYRFVRADGEIRWLRELTRAKHIKDGRVMQTLGVVQDVTNRVRREQELLYKDALADQAEAITDIGHFIYDEIKQKYLYVSPGMARIHGMDRDALVTRAVSWEGDLDVIHPEDREFVRRAYDKFLAEGGDWQVDYRLMRTDGEVRWIREVGKAHVINHGIAEQTIGVLQDITRQKNAEQEIIRAKETLEQQVVERTRELANTVKQLQEEIEEREKIAAELEFLANHDALTGLPSLRLCKDRLDQSLAEARRNRQTSAVMFLDLDGFKAVNDQHGHEFGDRLLKVAADRIKAEIRETDTVARIGGDEFVIILSSLPEIAIAQRIASNLVAQLAKPIFIEEVKVGISASIGISLYPDNGTTAEELIRSADKAMYRIKGGGKNDFGFVAAPKF